ncbi:hypothetical protein KC365_g13731, partial [Hortaea werneckii]
MNHHMAAGPGQPPHMPAMPMHGQSRRQQDYHAWAQQQPHSPMHNPYATYPPPMYYPNQQPPYGYPPPRWQPPTPYQHGPYASRPQYP